jgi:hypothetical protein
MSEESKALVPVVEKKVDVYGDEVPAVLVQTDDSGQPVVYVPVRPICDYLGVAWSAQRLRINRDPVLSEETERVIVTITDSRQTMGREMLCLPLDYLNGWLFGINANRVKPDIRQRLIRYQRDCYRILAEAFVPRALPAGQSTTASNLMQVRELGLAIARMAEEQLEFEQRLSTTEERVDQTVTVVGDLTQRVATLEKRVAPGEAVTDDQASQISQAVKSVAIVLTRRSGSNQFGAVYGELYRKFGITSYKLLPASRFQEAMDYLTDWHQSLVGEEPF